MIRSMQAIIGGLVVSAAMLPSAWAANESPLVGKKVTVISWDARFKIGDKVISPTELGDTYTVDRVKGDWVGVQGRKGYLKQSEVVDADRAMDYLTKMIERDPSTATYLNRGILHFKRNEIDAAIKDCTESIKLDPKDYSAFNSRANAYSAKQEYDKAIADFTAALAINPKNEVAIFNRGAVWRNKGDYDKAIADCNKALEINPKYVFAYDTRGLSWSDKHEVDKAIADYSEAIKLDPYYTLALIHRGTALTGKGEYDKAIEDFDAAIKIDPNNAEAYLNRGIALDDKNEYDKAIADYDVAIRLNPNNSPAFNDRGWAYGGKQDFKHALADYDQAVNLDPKNNFALANRAWLRASCAEVQYRDGNGAVSDATKACELTSWKDDGNVEILAVALAEAGKFDDAIKRLKQSMEMKPDNRKDFRDKLLAGFAEKKPYHQEGSAPTE